MLQWRLTFRFWPFLMIKAVFFDLYNTLTKFDPPREEIQIRAAREIGYKLDARGVTLGYVAADELMTKQNTERHISKLSRQERRAFFADYEQCVLRGAGVEVPKDVADQVWNVVRRTPQQMVLFDDVLHTVGELKGNGLTVGLISNMAQDLTVLTESLGLNKYLDIVLTSQIAGAEKPHARIFLMALELAQVGPQEAVHVGDQYHGDVVGARNVGIHPVLVDRDRLLTQFDDVDRIEKLQELLELVLKKE